MKIYGLIAMHVAFGLIGLNANASTLCSLLLSNFPGTSVEKQILERSLDASLKYPERLTAISQATDLDSKHQYEIDLVLAAGLAEEQMTIFKNGQLDGVHQRTPEILAAQVAKNISKNFKVMGGLHSKSKLEILAAFQLAKAFRKRNYSEKASFKVKSDPSPDVINNLMPFFRDLRNLINGPQGHVVIDKILHPLTSEDGYLDFKRVADDQGIKNLP